MGLLPLTAWILAHQLTGARVIIQAGATRELLFFALSTASTTLLSSSDGTGVNQSQPWSFGGLIIPILATLCYGVFVTGEVLHAAIQTRFAYYASVGLAIGAFIYSATITGYIHWRSSK